MEEFAKLKDEMRQWRADKRNVGCDCVARIATRCHQWRNNTEEEETECVCRCHKA